MTKKNFLAAASSLAVLTALLTGCADTPAGAANTGALLVRVNPEIRIEYDREGLVTALAGANDEGRVIVAGYPDYIGKPCGDVLEDLVGEHDVEGRVGEGECQRVAGREGDVRRVFGGRVGAGGVEHGGDVDSGDVSLGHVGS